MGVRKQNKLWKGLPILRAIGVLSAVGVVTSLVTFAAIQSNGNALTGNTIQTATANLQISRDGGTFADNVTGFTFSGLVPGGTPQPTANGGYAVWLKNVGTAPMTLNLTVPVQPTVNGTVDLSKVSVVLTPVQTNGSLGTSQSLNLASLIAGRVTIANSSLAVNGMVNYQVQVSMAADAVTGNSATISNLNLSFGGVL
jgi:hypothetical protein